METKKEKFKRYAMSSFITFTTGFALYIVADPTFSVDTLSNGAILGALTAALRAGFKAVVEYLVAKWQAKVV